MELGAMKYARNYVAAASTSLAKVAADGASTAEAVTGIDAARGSLEHANRYLKSAGSGGSIQPTVHQEMLLDVARQQVMTGWQQLGGATVADEFGRASSIELGAVRQVSESLDQVTQALVELLSTKPKLRRGL